jgi:hypothetical protein
MATLVIPCERSVPQHLSQPQPLRLPSVENRLGDVRREAGERQEGQTYAMVTSSCSARFVIHFTCPHLNCADSGAPQVTIRRCPPFFPRPGNGYIARRSPS